MTRKYSYIILWIYIQACIHVCVCACVCVFITSIDAHMWPRYLPVTLLHLYFDTINMFHLSFLSRIDSSVYLFRSTSYASRKFNFHVVSRQHWKIEIFWEFFAVFIFFLFSRSNYENDRVSATFVVPMKKCHDAAALLWFPPRMAMGLRRVLVCRSRMVSN